VFHTADPIAMGTCNGILSTCSLGGYAMESMCALHNFAVPITEGCFRCHTGKTIVYNTVSNLSWSVDIRNHGIITIIERVLGEPWLPSLDIGREVPEAVPQDNCIVRFRLAVLF